MQVIRIILGLACFVITGMTIFSPYGSGYLGLGFLIIGSVVLFHKRWKVLLAVIWGLARSVGKKTVARAVKVHRQDYCQIVADGKRCRNMADYVAYFSYFDERGGQKSILVGRDIGICCAHHPFPDATRHGMLASETLNYAKSENISLRTIVPAQRYRIT